MTFVAPQAARLAGNRLHLRHGPIDLVIKAHGPAAAIEAAYQAACRRFPEVLPELVAELALLKAPLGGQPPPVTGPVARRMVKACLPHAARFITPMAAVAGAVAEEILAAMTAAAPLAKALVNNGGDIAIHLAPGRSTTLGVIDRPDRFVTDRARMAGTARIEFASPVRGVATSGWRGRSQSLGIADAVTVLATTAAAADAAATMIANAVDIDHPAIERLPACEVKADSDLGRLPVTVAVGRLPADAVRSALARGASLAERLVETRVIEGALLCLKGAARVVGAAPCLAGPFPAVRASAPIERHAP